MFINSCFRCDVLLVIRMLILWRKKLKYWYSIEKLQSHQDSRGQGTNAYEEAMNIYQHIERLLPDNPSSKDIVHKICGLIDVNALETIPPEGCVAIYETACLLEHSCLANTRHTFKIDNKGRPRITVIAVCSIQKYVNVISHITVFSFSFFSFLYIFLCFFNEYF